MKKSILTRTILTIFFSLSAVVCVFADEVSTTTEAPEVDLKLLLGGLGLTLVAIIIYFTNRKKNK